MKKEITLYSLNQMYPIPVPGSHLFVNENGYCYVIDDAMTQYKKKLNMLYGSYADTDTLLGVVYTEEDRKEFDRIWKERKE